MSRIEIETPIGPITANLDELGESLSYLMTKVKKTDKVDQAISTFLQEDEDTTHPIESKRKYYHDRSYIFWMEALMEVINKGYDITRAENYNYGDTMTAPIWFDEKVGDVTVKVPHKLVMYVQSKTNPEERFVIMFTPFDEYEVDMVFQFRSGCFNYTDFWQKVEDYFYNQGLLKGAHFTADFKMLETPKLDWNDIVIKSEDRQVLDRNLVKFIDSVDSARCLYIFLKSAVFLPVGLGL